MRNNHPDYRVGGGNMGVEVVGTLHWSNLDNQEEGNFDAQEEVVVVGNHDNLEVVVVDTQVEGKKSTLINKI